MHILSVLALVFLTIDCQLDPYQYNVDLEEYNKIILKELEKDKSININRRKLSNLVEYVNPISKLNIGSDSMIEEFSVKIIAKEDVSYINYPISYKNTTIISYKLEVKDDKGNIIPLDTNVHNCTLNEYHNVIINTNLKNDYELSVWLKLMHDTDNMNEKNFLYTLIVIYVPSMFEGTHCKYIFNVDSNSINIGIQSNEFSRLNSSAFIYENDCPSSYVSDIIRTTPYQINWNAIMEVNMSIIETPTYAFIMMPKNNYITGGTNFNFTKNELSISSINVGDSFNNENPTFYILNMYNFTENERYMSLNLTFSSSPVFWNVTIDDLKNTSTAESISLAKTILLEDISSKPSYYKIGKWIYNNIKYNGSYFGKSLNISQIINLRQGVCQHFTELYNALLNSIGIEAVYASGYSITDLKKPTDGKHAWTVAKINGKWLGLDATWNIFNEDGYLPQCHLFLDFGSTYSISTYSDVGKVNFFKKEDVKIVEIANFECDKPYLNINRNCKLCKEIDDSLPYYDFNSGECVSKCTQITYNSICYDSCEQIGDGNIYVKNENNECKIKIVENEKKIDVDSEGKNNNSYSSIKTHIIIILFFIIILN